MKTRNTLLFFLLIAPSVFWMVGGVINIFVQGFYSYTFLYPLAFKIHTFTLLPIMLMYLFILITLDSLSILKRLLVAVLFIMTTNAIYELLFALFISPYVYPNPAWGGVIVSLPVVVVGILSIYISNRKLHFLSISKKRILLSSNLFFMSLFMFVLLENGEFFSQIKLYLDGEITRNPHNFFWIVSKATCLWMLLPLCARKRSHI